MKKITLLLFAVFAFSFNAFAQSENDLCSGALPITPSAEGTGCATFTFTAPASTDGTTDSGVPTVCSDPGLDIWFTWTATSTGLIFNDGTGNPGIAIYASCADATAGVAIDCSGTFAAADFELSGWNIDDDLIIQVYDFAGSTSDLSFCLEEFTPPTCPDPSGLAATNLTETTADLGWTENGVATSWNVEWGPTGFTPGTGTIISGTTNNPEPITGLTSGTTYDFYVQSDCTATAETSAQIGPSTFTTSLPPPANDDLANAETMVCGMTYSEDTSLATLDEDDAPDGTSADMDAPNVWYTYTGTGVEEEVTLELCGSAYDTSVLVYTGMSGALTIVADNDDGGAANCPGATTRSFLTFVSDGTTTYYIAVEGWNATSTGMFTMNVSCVAAAPAPANDLCVDAEALTLGSTVSGTTVGATVTPGDANPSCESNFATIVDVWYTFTGPASTAATIITTISGTSDQANIAVYTDCTLATQLGCSDANGGESLYVDGLTAGTTYYLRVWGDGIAARNNSNSSNQLVEGTFDIVVNETTLSTSDFDNGSIFSYYPNPVNNTLTLNAQNEISNVAVFNMLGQEVIRTAPNAVSNEVDMSNLQSGAYFVQVTVGQATETVRVIKN